MSFQPLAGISVGPDAFRPRSAWLRATASASPPSCEGEGRRASHGDERRYIDDPHWRELVLFSEYFCGDSGRGLGASHQTGWSALVATCLAKMHRTRDGDL